MEPIDLLNQTRVIWNDEVTPGLKCIFNKTLLFSARIITATLSLNSYDEIYAGLLTTLTRDQAGFHPEESKQFGFSRA